MQTSNVQSQNCKRAHNAKPRTKARRKMPRAPLAIPQPLSKSWRGRPRPPTLTGGPGPTVGARARARARALSTKHNTCSSPSALECYLGRFRSCSYRQERVVHRPHTQRHMMKNDTLPSTRTHQNTHLGSGVSRVGFFWGR